MLNAASTFPAHLRVPGVVPEWRNKAQNNTSALMLTKLLKEMRTRRAPFGRGKGGGREAAERPELE